MSLDEFTELYSFIRRLYKKSKDKCKQLHKNNTYDPYADGFAQGVASCFAAFFHYISYDTMFKICSALYDMENKKG